MYKIKILQIIETNSSISVYCYNLDTLNLEKYSYENIKDMITNKEVEVIL